MKPMWAAFAAIALIAIVVSYGLEQAGFSSAERASGQNVRLE